MKLGVLFSGGKDSCYAAWLAKKQKHKLSCLISMYSENKNSFMFHTPSISKVESQAKTMNIPLIIQKTKGEKELELKDLEEAITDAKEQYGIEGIVTGAIESVYQASRIQKICDKLNLECFNPLWQKSQEEHLQDLVKNKFRVILVGVFAFPFNQTWLGRKIDNQFVTEIKALNKYKLNIAGEGGEYETFVLDCPLFKKPLKVKSYKDIREGENSWRREIELA